MTDPQFFSLAAEMALSDIAELADARVGREAPTDWRVRGLSSLSDAGPYDVTFCTGPRQAAGLRTTRAGACLLREQDRAFAPPGIALLFTDEPGRAFARLAAVLYPDSLRPVATGLVGVSPGATIDPSARLEVGAIVGSGSVLGRRVEVGSGTTIGPHCVIGDGVRIGRDCTIASHVTVTHAFIGDRVVLQSGARIGQDGFGFVPGSRGHAKIAQLGRAIIQDDVEIGANATIDRGALDDTIVGEGTKIDNLVHIAHNVVVGRHCFIAAQVGIAGSTQIGDFVAIGGQAGIGGHITIGAGARIAGKAGVLHDVPPRARIGGSPAQPVTRWLREAVRNHAQQNVD